MLDRKNKFVSNSLLDADHDNMTRRATTLMGDRGLIDQ